MTRLDRMCPLLTSVAFVVCAQSTLASPFASPDQRAQSLMREGRAAEAADIFESAQHRAMALHEAGDTAGAMAIWQSLADASSEYNLGTTLTRLGDYQRALEAFDRAAGKLGTPADNGHNRAIAEQLLALQQQAQQSADGESGNSPENATRPEDGQPSPAQPSDTAGDADDESEFGAEPEAPAEARQEPRAEQSQRADREQRESNQATDQLLQRVPDDPAGLLRARIVREHQRRHNNAPDALQPW